MRATPQKDGMGIWITAREVVEKTTADKGYKKEEYLPYIRDGLRQLLEDGKRLPPIKKVTAPTSKIQVTAHLHVFDALQGYWERNKKDYIHRAKSDYRALYFGTLFILEEEELLKGVDNSSDISKLETFVREREYRHKINQDQISIRHEVRTSLIEKAEGLISEEEFDRTMKDMLEIYHEPEDKQRIAKFIDAVISEEQTKIGNLIRQQKHREYEKFSKGLREVNEK